MEEITGYRWAVYYDGTLLHEDMDEYETEEEAKDEAESYIEDKINQWKNDDAWHDEDDESMFYIDIIDCTED